MAFLNRQRVLDQAIFSTSFAIGFCASIQSAIYSDYALRISSTQITYSTIANLVASFVGAIAAWPLTNVLNLGRRLTTLVGLTSYYLAAILITSATSYAQLVACQVFYGLGVGILFVSAIVWMVEMAEAECRGRKVALMYVAISAGQAIATWIEYGFDHSTSTSDMRFRLPLGLQLIVLLPPMFFVWSADESWRWLLQRNQPDKARAILANYMSTSQSAPEFERAFAAVSNHYYLSNGSGSLFQKATIPGSSLLHPWRRLLLACGIQTMRCLSEFPVVSQWYFLTSMRITGFSSDYILSSMLPTFVFLFSLLPYFLVDRRAASTLSPFGRRGLLIMGAFGLAGIFLLATIVAAATGYLSFADWYNASSTPLIAGYFVLFWFATLFYTVGYRVIVDLYTAEIAASNVRTETISIAHAWGLAVDVGMAYGAAYGIVDLGTYFFLVWMFLNLIWMAVIWLVYPETQGRSLEDLDTKFAGGLRILAGTDRYARRGGNVGRGVEEFEVILGNDGQGHGVAAELDENRPGAPETQLPGSAAFNARK